MASWDLAEVCRFCGSKKDVIIDLIETLLGEKLVKYFPLKFEPSDSLPKLSCTDCASTIEQMESFVQKALEVEKDMLEHSSRFRSNIMSVAQIRSLANSVSAQNIKQPTQSVKEVLQKLNTTSVIVKKIQKPLIDPLEGVGQLEDEPFIKMKMEVLDEEIENLPAEDFVQYNDTDDEEYNSNFHNILSVNIKDIGLTDDSDFVQDNDDEDYVPSNLSSRSKRTTDKQVCHQRIKSLPPPKNLSMYKVRQSNPKGIVINLTDPCHYVCVTCKSKFCSFEELQTHINQNIACKKVSCTCEQCGKFCETRRALYQHRLSHNPKPQLICDQCGKVYTNSFNLENHKSQVHGAEVEELGYVYKCCEQTFPTRRELNEHIATHSKILNLLCDTCGKSYTSHKALRSHNQSHLNIRPFSCNVCEKSFRTKLLLVQHSHVHTGVKVFNCDVCDKSFAKKESLKKHYKIHSSEPVTWSSTGEKITVKSLDQLQ
ncbi:zinc finger protein 624-like [Malaya genurostris]|uniref:zinc finger protein 624-like n=1 Tax=Malaya genurostris TaxID=325434 RepID=UPI0026F3F71D|nr:zinc finger protein 624-like [Malaya genurostris]